MDVAIFYVVLLVSLITQCSGSVLGGRCEYDVDCETTQTYCHNHNVCTCMRGYYPDDMNRNCLATVGSRCKDSRECSNTLLNSECDDDECACRNGYVAHSSNKKCLAMAPTYQSACEEQIQCTESFGDGAQCVMNKCVCQQNQHYADNECRYNRGLGDDCTTTADCYISEEQIRRLECKGGKCHCRAEFTNNDNVCTDGAMVLTTSMFSILVWWLIMKIIV